MAYILSYLLILYLAEEKILITLNYIELSQPFSQRARTKCSGRPAVSMQCTLGLTEATLTRVIPIVEAAQYIYDPRGKGKERSGHYRWVSG